MPGTSPSVPSRRDHEKLKGKLVAIDATPSLVREVDSHAIINVDSSALERAKAMKAKILREREQREHEINELKNRIARLEQLFSELTRK